LMPAATRLACCRRGKAQASGVRAGDFRRPQPLLRGPRAELEVNRMAPASRVGWRTRGERDTEATARIPNACSPASRARKASRSRGRPRSFSARRRRRQTYAMLELAAAAPEPGRRSRRRLGRDSRPLRDGRSAGRSRDPPRSRVTHYRGTPCVNSTSIAPGPPPQTVCSMSSRTSNAPGGPATPNAGRTRRELLAAEIDLLTHGQRPAPGEPERRPSHRRPRHHRPREPWPTVCSTKPMRSSWSTCTRRICSSASRRQGLPSGAKPSGP